MGCRQVVSHQILILTFAGSSPATPSNFFAEKIPLLLHCPFSKAQPKASLRVLRFYSIKGTERGDRSAFISDVRKERVVPL